ncbi:hypothetical protein BGW36DRAFT_366186 [Talaromyces proteolyticus]|uniref:Ricin B lectin domain-containing protein n=1 Tax=Talaromyces proteolyticus TaxID=1131652 RepID=A0AAD4Q0S5_9EURO|nr:uncharacterized protein BGW36DRAFT_366186 [Talaromyces proteolyticus]KAH8704800.1 hypothetical protein BGW36DRAFT_366186 [Talaromyces proteolyticus]
MQNADDTVSLFTAEEEGCYTPTHTSMPSDDWELPSYSRLNTVGMCPWKDTTYIIRNAETDLVISLNDGDLILSPQEKGHYCHWHCVENSEGWFGFRNVAAGRYIGHNNNRRNWRFVVEGRQHREWEYFCARQHPSGGHILLVKHWNGFQPMTVGGPDNTELVVGERDVDPARWEFIKIES